MMLNEEVDQAFIALNHGMSTAPILALPNYIEDLTVETNTSLTGIRYYARGSRMRHASMDFIEGFPKSRYKKVVIVVLDKRTIFAHFMALYHPYTSSTVATKFSKHTILPTTGEDGQFLVKPLQILQRQLVRTSNLAGIQVLVLWSNLSPEEANWEDYADLKAKFPDFNIHP
uniref:Chromo domain-containing protein n=1 Tax=Solanum lycopersicum TaxID=4081 RepID=A0A3Q7J811_SOLLC